MPAFQIKEDPPKDGSVFLAIQGFLDAHTFEELEKKINKQNYMVVASNIRVIRRNCTLRVICILPSNTVKL